MRPLVSTDDAAAHGRSRTTSAGASVVSIGRRHRSKLFYALALIGVPTAVILGSGGRHTIAFWIMTLVWVAAAFYVTALSLFVVFMVLSPILLVLADVVSERSSAVAAWLFRGLVLVLASSAFVVAAELGDTSEVRLPTPWPNFGALLIISVSVAVAYGLWSLGGKYKPAKRTPVYVRRHSVPEPEEEYWSDQFVVGWRAWNWDGSSLRGVYAQWPSHVFEATCPHCECAPSWNHACGIYAAKIPADVHVFHGGPCIVGRVEMWGDVIEHEFGYRASHARITHVWVGDQWRAERIGLAYPEVEVTVGRPGVNQEVA